MVSQMECHATKKQIGEAAGLRTWCTYPLREDLNFITHSEDKNPHKYGFNRFAVKDGIFDPEAEKVIEEGRKASTKNKK